MNKISFLLKLPVNALGTVRLLHPLGDIRKREKP